MSERKEASIDRVCLDVHYDIDDGHLECDHEECPYLDDLDIMCPVF